jgi:hypothetical protein
MAGFDVKALLDGIIGFASQNYILILVGLVLLVLFSNRGVFARIRYGIEKALTDNWQLTLLASTGIALSLASGYTTFDGLRNFTNAPLLSVAISFGIQGVMLIVAWLIGESFATGMNQLQRKASACAWSTPASACCSAWPLSAPSTGC